ncbi:MAG: endonuclease [Bacteroidales bacterium]|nr:endonuclease [Bacteroidales bacterium]
MKRTGGFIWLMLLPMMAMAVIPPSYYDKADGMKKADLKAVMRSIIAKAAVLDYGSGADRTWTGFYITDRYNGNQVRDRYSNEEFFFPSTASEKAASAVSGMNIEHSFPKSWWGGAENQAYKDLFNLMPCEQRINSSKSNYVMGVVTNVKTNNGCTKVGTGDAGGKNVSLWEPADNWKGDFARNYFYMVTAYSNLHWEKEGVNMLENNEWPTLQKWAYELLLEWNRQDPVDEIEKDRNDAVYGIQGNRNPFIDYPNLAEYIWGDSIEFAFSVDGSNTGIPDGPNDGEFMAYDANEIVSSVYSCRFDANWAKYKEGVTYTLDVYTKDSAGEKHSLAGFPVETKDNTYRVKEGVKPSTMYYYQVFVYNSSGELEAKSNEVVVDFPAVEPVFAVTPTQATFSTVPGVASGWVKISTTMMATEERIFTARVEAPFEISDDEEAEEWVHELTLKADASFFVRLAATEAEGVYRGDLTLSTKGLKDRIVPLTANVDELRHFFEDFETAGKSSYAAATVDCSAATWYMADALIYKDKNANDEYSLRLKSGGVAEMRTDKAMGCDSLWFYASNYNTDTNMKLTVSYSLDGGESWTPVVEEQPMGTWQRYGYAVKQKGSIRLKFECSGTSGKRVNVDDIQMSDYKDETGIDLVTDSAEEYGAFRGVYDMSGRRVGSAPGAMQSPLKKGVYIVNGKKVVY